MAGTRSDPWAHAPNEQFREAFLQPPFWQDGGSLRFPLGTDAVGRDVLSRLIHGSRYSLFIGCIVVSIIHWVAYSRHSDEFLVLRLFK